MRVFHRQASNLGPPVQSWVLIRFGHCGQFEQRNSTVSGHGSKWNVTIYQTPFPKTSRPVLDFSVTSIPIRAPKLKQHWYQSVRGRAMPLEWSAKANSLTSVILVNLCYHQQLDYTCRSSRYQNWRTILFMSLLYKKFNIRRISVSIYLKTIEFYNRSFFM